MIRIYYRVSTDKQDYDMQDRGIQNYLNSLEARYEDCMVYQDFGLSGTTTTRPAYQRLLTEVRDKDTIIAYEFSRLWRDMEEQSRATKALIPRGIVIKSPIDGVIDSLENSLSADIKGVINQHEARRVKRRSMEGIRALQEKCAKGEVQWNGRGPDKKKRSPEGYKKMWEKRRLQTVKEI